MKDKILQCISSAVFMLNETLENKLPVEAGRDCLLYGAGSIDSISLVTLISFVEQEIESVFNKPIILANEKAMSMRNSPFYQ